MSDRMPPAAPLVRGHGPRLFEVFLEPTCPFCARTYAKLDDLMAKVGEDRLTLRIILHSQPWHLFSGIVVRSILAASTLPEGRAAAERVMAAVFAHRMEFEFEDHCAGPNLDTTPRDLVKRIEERSGVPIAAAFARTDLDREIKRHTRYARQNGIHVSPTFMIDGLIDPSLGSSDPVEDWAARLGGS